MQGNIIFITFDINIKKIIIILMNERSRSKYYLYVMAIIQAFIILSINAEILQRMINAS